MFAVCAAVAALLLGRVFCGWICPLGTVFDVIARLCIGRKGKSVVSAGTASALRSVKYGLLLSLLLLAALGIQATGWFDPLSLATRTFALSFYPALDFYTKALKTWGIMPVAWYEFARDQLGVADIKAIFFLGQTLFFLLFVFLAALLLVQRRFWCRNLCPLGAMLGVLSSFRVLRIRINCGKREGGSADEPGTCTGCGRCVASCKMGAIVAAESGPRVSEPQTRDQGRAPSGGEGAASEGPKSPFTPICERGEEASPPTLIKWGEGGFLLNCAEDMRAWKRLGVLNQECIHCQTCVSVCSVGAAKLRFEIPRRSPTRVFPGRRGFLASFLTGLAALPLLKRNPFLIRDKEGKIDAVVGSGPVLRPPGAHGLLKPDGTDTRTDAEFLAKCIRCGSCMKVCANNALHPSLLEAGPAGLWAPMLVPRIGYCEYFCFDCTRVCPTGALQQLDEDTKMRVRMGTAFVDKERCIPWVEGVPCTKCEEHCPIFEKAIRMQEVELISGPNKGKTVFAPFVDRDLCIGCGYCENVCPAEGRAGIRISPPQRPLIQETEPDND